MRFRTGRQSSNVEDRRGGAMRGRRVGGRGIGVGTIVLALVAMYFGIDPAVVLNGAGVTSRAPVETSAPAAGIDDADRRFISMVLADTEDTWKAVFARSGRQYAEPRLVLFSGATQTACGVGQSAMGPFYCPPDQSIYIDLSFHDDLARRFGAPGDFAQAYVLAHEVGHHVQNLLGIAAQVQDARQRAGEVEANRLSVRLELQADCLAGVWAHRADRARQVLEDGDVEEALRAATAIGDDRLQRQSRGYAVPDSFTHGTSEQRVRWFRRGLQGGSPGDCNTFDAADL